MKRVTILTVLVMISLTSFAQEITHNQLGSATKETRGSYTSYIGKDESVYKIGDRLTIGVPSSNKTFSFITEGDGFMLPITPLTVGASGIETEIKKIAVVGNNRMGYFVTFRTKGVSGLSNYTITVENAIANGELKSFGMSSDEALTALKKAKDKLDLELISQIKYDSIKSDLIKYIQ